MFRLWVKIMPLFVVQWMAKKQCARMKLAGMEVVNPFIDVLFITDMNPEEEENGE